MSNAIHLINVMVTAIGIVAWTVSCALLLIVIRYSNKQGLSDHNRDLKIAAIVCGGAALYMWSIFAELTK